MAELRNALQDLADLHRATWDVLEESDWVRDAAMSGILVPRDRHHATTGGDGQGPDLLGHSVAGSYGPEDDEWPTGSCSPATLVSSPPLVGGAAGGEAEAHHTRLEGLAVSLEGVSRVREGYTLAMLCRQKYFIDIDDAWTLRLPCCALAVTGRACVSARGGLHRCLPQGGSCCGGEYGAGGE